MKVITTVNEKGGVGKTTCAVHIAAGLAIKGMRVVLIDADPQGHAALTLGISKEPCLYDLLVRNAPFKTVLRYVSSEIYERPGEPVKGQLFVIPSNVETRNIANSINDAYAVARRMQELKQAQVDVVLFDTPPTPSLLHGSIYIATDAVIYPTKLEALSFDGLSESFQHREQSDIFRAQQGKAGITNMGIIPTMYNASTLEHRENLADLRSNFGELVWEPIPTSTVWTEYTRLQRPVWTFAARTKAAAHAWDLVTHAEGALAYVGS